MWLTAGEGGKPHNQTPEPGTIFTSCHKKLQLQLGITLWLPVCPPPPAFRMWPDDKVSPRAVCPMSSQPHPYARCTPFFWHQQTMHQKSQIFGCIQPANLNIIPCLRWINKVNITFLPLIQLPISYIHSVALHMFRNSFCPSQAMMQSHLLPRISRWNIVLPTKLHSQLETW